MTVYNFSDVSALVVDDYRYMRTLLTEMLREFGFCQVYSADDGAMAGEILRKNQVDVVFLDWNMPNVSGVEFTEGVRRGDYGNDPYLPILMVSGYTGQSRIMQALDAGVHTYVLKPVTPQSLAERLSQVIENPPRFIKTDSYFGPYRPSLAASA